VGAKQPARTTARKQVAPVSKEHQEPVWAAGAPTPGGIPAHRARRLAVYRSATRLAKPQAGRALRRSRAPAQAEQSTTRVSMNAATWEAPRHAACHPQTGVHQELAGPAEARGSSGASSGSGGVGGVGSGGTSGGGTGGTGSCLPPVCFIPACAGELQPNPNDPCGCPICVPNPDAGTAKDAGSPDSPICLGPPPPCALPPKTCPAGSQLVSPPCGCTGCMPVDGGTSDAGKPDAPVICNVMCPMIACTYGYLPNPEPCGCPSCAPPPDAGVAKKAPDAGTRTPLLHRAAGAACPTGRAPVPVRSSAAASVSPTHTTVHAPAPTACMMPTAPQVSVVAVWRPSPSRRVRSVHTTSASAMRTARRILPATAVTRLLAQRRTPV